MAEAFRIAAPPSLPAAGRYGVAVAFPAAAFGLAVVGQPVFENAPFLPFLLAVLGTALLGGFGPGVVSVAAASALAYAFILRAIDTTHVRSAPIAIAVFATVALVVAAVAAAVRVAVQERDAAARTLAASEARERARALELQATLDAVPALVLIAHDREARRMTGSRAAHELLRTGPQRNPSRTGDSPPTNFRVFRDGVELGPAELPTQAAARTGRPWRGVELELVFDDGARLRLLGNAEPIRDEAGQVVGAVSAFVDVTRLAEALRVRDAFLSIASHELKTPLTALKLSAQSLRRAAVAQGGAPARAADQVDQQVSRLVTLVDTLLDVSQLNERRLRLDPAEVDLAALVREVAGRLTGDAAAGGPAVVVEAAAPVVGRWDRVRLEQVAANLISNALKYGAGKPVVARVEAGAGLAHLAVIDGGIGIPAAEQGRIFERFERAEAARGYGGFGLGLWISRALVEAHGGAISVESAPGAGSTFRVRLPLAGPPEA
jgi:signal transduction histidine kinase